MKTRVLTTYPRDVDFTICLTFRLEELDTNRLVVGTVLIKDGHNVLFSDAKWSIEKVQHIGRVRYAVLQCRFGIGKAIITVAHKVFE